MFKVCLFAGLYSLILIHFRELSELPYDSILYIKDLLLQIPFIPDYLLIDANLVSRRFDRLKLTTILSERFSSSCAFMISCTANTEREPLLVGRSAKQRGQPKVALHALVSFCFFYSMVVLVIVYQYPYRHPAPPDPPLWPFAIWAFSQSLAAFSVAKGFVTVQSDGLPCCCFLSSGSSVNPT